MSEQDLTQKISRAMRFDGARPPHAILGIGDDAALWGLSHGHQAVLTCDWFLEGVHFLREKHPPDSVGWKCLARALSDVAAMGAAPRCFLLSLALPANYTGQWLNHFLRGLRRASRRFECPLAGGDTTRQSRVLINVAVLGELRAHQAVLRDGASPGDVLFTSGRLGEAELGLRLFRKGRGQTKGREALLRKHLYPEPRLTLGRWLAKHRLASAMMDLSDGLSTDLARLCAASGVGGRVFLERLSGIHSRRGPRFLGENALGLALHGGDDYELLFTVPPAKVKQVPAAFQDIPLTAIGEITRSKEIVLRDHAGRERKLSARGWDAFRR